MALEEIGQVNIPRDTTLKELIEVEKQSSAYLGVIAQSSMSGQFDDYAAIQRLVKQGLAPQAFNIGDQINTKFTYNGTEYDCPFDIVAFQDAELEDGEEVPAMILQMHYCSPYNVAFDMREALYYAADGLTAGTYKFTVGEHSYVTEDVGRTFQFTLANAVPAGGILRTSNTYNVSFEGATLSVYAEHADETPQEEVTISAGSSGTSLGTINNSDVTETLNQCQRIIAGYNRYSQSAMRQWLNSKEDVGEWWEPQNNFDAPPAALTSYPGFMSHFDDDFLSILTPTKVVTSLNTLIDGGGQDVTYDTFWPISLEQANINPLVSGVEGSVFEYWQRACGTATPVARSDVEGQWPLTYAINAQSTAQAVRLRSANRTTANNVYTVRASGAVDNLTANTAYRVAPACVIC